MRAAAVVTSPIFYVNAAPHLGHLHTLVLCDALARWRAVAAGRPAFLATGTDEHGLKIQQAAERAQTPTARFCSDNSARFRALVGAANVDAAAFVRTTAPAHRVAVEALWRRLRAGGHIYKSAYAGWYSVPDESFVTELQTALRPDGVRVSLESGHPVEWVTEDNYKFRLTAFVAPLLQWLTANPDAVQPPSRRNEVLAWLDARAISDLSVSRLSDKVRWGIPVPDDPAHSIYVWLDALTNYLTVTGFPWAEPGAAAPDAFPSRPELLPVDYHVIGKDILRFHAVYWPAFLLAAGLPLPRHIIAHSHWTVERQKMSKSKGNVVDPFEALQTYGVDVLRYFLLREARLADDADFSHAMVVQRCNSELANSLGNLLSRATGSAINPTQTWPACDDSALAPTDRVVLEELRALPALVQPQWDAGDFHLGLLPVLQALYNANKHFTEQKPWALKGAAEAARRDQIVTVALEAVRVAALLMQCIMPSKTAQVLDRLGVAAGERQLRHVAQRPAPGRPLGAAGGPIFPRHTAGVAKEHTV